MPDTPESQDDSYLELMRAELARVQQQEAATAVQAAGTNPDRYATQKRVAGYLGYPVAAVEATPEASEAEFKRRQLQEVTATRPVLQAKYTDVDFHKLASDDHDTLSKIADAVVSTAKYVVGAPGTKNGFATDLAAGALFDTSRGAAGIGRAAADIAASAAELFLPGLAAMEKSGTLGGDPLRRLAEGFDLIGQDAKSIADRLSPPTSGLVQSGVSSGVRSLGSNMLMLPMALMAGPATGAALMSAQAGGSSYGEAKS